MATTLSPANVEFKYKLSVSWRYANIDFLGLPSFQDGTLLALKSIYVATRLLLEPEGKQRHFLASLLNRHKHIVVLGDPGAGKSVLIQLIAYSLGSAGQTPLESQIGEFIPIPILLRDYKVQNWRTAADMLQDYAASLPDDVRQHVQPAWLLEILRSGRGALLIDGLDEVGSAVDRRQLRDEVLLPLLAESKDSLAVITSRAAGYDEAPFESITRCYLAPFGPEEIQDYVFRWYTLREPDPNRRQQLIASLNAAIKRSPQTEELAQRPGMLAMMALIHRATGKLPPDLLRLYDQIVAAYLETIQSYRKLPPFEASLEQMKRWLAAVGWRMQLLRTESGPRLYTGRSEVIDWLRTAIGRETADPERFLDYVLKRSGLLVTGVTGEIAFAHLSFQEYFAAWRLRGDVRRFEELCLQCTELAAAEVWHETLVFLFEMLAEFPGAGDELLRRIVEGETGQRSTVARLVISLLGSSTTGIEDAQELGAKFIFTTWLEEGFQNAKSLAPFAERFADRFGEWAGEWLDKNSRTLGKKVPVQVINALVLLGNSLKSLGGSARAGRLYDKALAVAERALADFGDDQILLAELGFVLNYAGNLMVSTGRTGQARQYFQRALEIFLRLVAQAPAELNYLRDLAVCYDKLGTVAFKADQIEQARQNYQQALEFRQRLVGLEPDNAGYLRDLSASYGNLGDLAKHAGEIEQARQYYRKSLKIREDLSKQEPDSADSLRDLSISLVNLGDVAGQTETAAQLYQHAFDIRQRLVNQEPDRTDYLRGLSISYERLGDAARDAGQPEQARRHYQQALDIIQRLADQEPDHPGRQIGLAISLNKLGGREHFERARAILTALRDKNQLRPKWEPLLASIEKSLAA